MPPPEKNNWLVGTKLSANGAASPIRMLFAKTIECSGIILAKLDGTAKGGAIFGIKQKLGLPVKFIGVGETLDDLEPFDPDTYVEALFE